MKRALTPEEVEQYGIVRERHPELELPDLQPDANVEYVRQGPTTHCRLFVHDTKPYMYGWAVFSPIDRAMKKPERPEIGEKIAFNRALKQSIW